MPFALPEDVGTTKRQRMTPTRALAAWERTKGRCVTCGEQIDGVRERWFVEHIRALELGGKDEDANLGPAHMRCKPAKDADDHSRAAKAKKAKRNDLGITKALRPAHQKIQSPGFPRAPKRREIGPKEQWLRDRRAEQEG